MRNRLSTLTLTLLVSAAGLMITGCGSDTDTFVPVPQQQIREFLIIPNGGSNTISVRGINLENGDTAVLSNNPSGTTPAMVRTHPTRPLFYVSNTGSGSITGYIVDANGGTTNVPGHPFAAPAGVVHLSIHPSGLFVYAGGTNEIRSYSVQPDGSLIQTGTNNLGGAQASFDGVFSNGGRFLHVPTSTGLTTFTVNQTTGQLSNGTATAAGNLIRDLSLHPNGTLILGTLAQPGANDDRIAPFTVDGNGVVTAQPTQALGYDVGLAEFARNGQFYTGTIAGNLLHGFNVVSNQGALTAIAGSPFNLQGAGQVIGIDPTNSLVYSAQPGAGNQLAGARRLADGTLQPAANSPFTGSLNTPFVFDFFQFLQ